MFKQATLAYLFDIVGLVAGFLIAYQLDMFSRYPWALALYPPLISTRIINGLLSGRLSTALHLGTVEAKFSGNTRFFYRLIHATIVLTLITSLVVSVLSLLFGHVFLGISLADFPLILSVLVATLAIGLVFSAVTIQVAFISFKRGLDPDIVVYPVIASSASIFITLCYAGVLKLLSSWLGVLIVVAIGLLHAGLVIYLVLKDYTDSEFARTVRESILMLLLVALIVTLTGTVFGGLTRFTQKTLAMIYPALLTAYPALINNISNVGSVVGSTANTKLALGLLKPTFSSIKDHAKNITSAWLASFLIFVILALASLAANQVISVVNVVDVVAVIWVSNILAVSGIVFVSYGVAIFTFRRGLNPENFVIPLETSFATIITSASLLITLVLLTLH